MAGPCLLAGVLADIRGLKWFLTQVTRHEWTPVRHGEDY
jgi:hypothetical protein